MVYTLLEQEGFAMEIGTSGGGCTAKTMRVISLLRSPEDAQKWGDAIVTLGATGGMPFQALYSMALAPLPSTDKSDDSTSGNESEENSAAGR